MLSWKANDNNEDNVNENYNEKRLIFPNRQLPWGWLKNYDRQGNISYIVGYKVDCAAFSQSVPTLREMNMLMRIRNEIVTIWVVDITNNKAWGTYKYISPVHKMIL